MDKVLITGANGFIGSHTVRLIESLGHGVVAVDVQARSPDLSPLYIDTDTHRLDVSDLANLRGLCEREGVTHIFHAAYPARDEDPEVLDFSLRATRNILEISVQQNIQRVVLASSGAVYGQLRKKGAGRVSEDDLVPIHPAYLYRSAKLLAEWLGDFYAENYGLSFVALRFSSVYGPGLGRGIPLAIKDGLLGRPCRPYLTRLPDDLVYVDDVAEAVRLALFCAAPPSRAYNIASGRDYDEKDLADAVRKALPKLCFEIGKHPRAALVGAHRSRDPLDISRAREELGFIPRVDLSTGVAEVVRWTETLLRG